MDPDMDMVEDQEKSGVEDVEVNSNLETVEGDPIASLDHPDIAYKVGGFNVNIMDQQIPFLGQLIASAILIMAAVFPKGHIMFQGYTIAVGVVAILFSAAGFYLLHFSPAVYDQHLFDVPLIGSCTIGYTLCLFLFAWWIIAAGVLTFGGPFEVTGNGYFATWAGFFAAAMAIGLSTQRVKDMNNFIRLAACSFILLCAIPSKLEGDYDGEGIYAMVLAAFTLALSMMCIMASHGMNMANHIMLYILMALALLWVVEAGLVTFRGPFIETGNGYFASWGAAFLCIAMAATNPHQ
eukprot:scaffold1901_cov126-Cylindrotheca_fusiformis.AAC.3